MLHSSCRKLGGIFLVILLVLQGWPPSALADEAVGRVMKAEGKVLADRPSLGTTDVPLTQDAPLYDGDIIKVGPKSSAALLIQGSLLTLSENSEFSLTQVASASHSFFDLIRGKMRSMISKIAGEKEIIVSTPNAVIGMRGTMATLLSSENVTLAGSLSEHPRAVITLTSIAAKVAERIEAIEELMEATRRAAEGAEESENFKQKRAELEEQRQRYGEKLAFLRRIRASLAERSAATLKETASRRKRVDVMKRDWMLHRRDLREEAKVLRLKGVKLQQKLEELHQRRREIDATLDTHARLYTPQFRRLGKEWRKRRALCQREESAEANRGRCQRENLRPIEVEMEALQEKYQEEREGWLNEREWVTQTIAGLEAEKRESGERLERIFAELVGGMEQARERREDKENYSALEEPFDSQVVVGRGEAAAFAEEEGVRSLAAENRAFSEATDELRMGRDVYLAAESLIQQIVSQIFAGEEIVAIAEGQSGNPTYESLARMGDPSSSSYFPEIRESVVQSALLISPWAALTASLGGLTLSPALLLETVLGGAITESEGEANAAQSTTLSTPSSTTAAPSGAAPTGSPIPTGGAGTDPTGPTFQKANQG